MLALMKPWRSLTDLKEREESFRDAYNIFINESSSETCRIIKNVQFFHECCGSARQRTHTVFPTVEETPTTVWTELDVPGDSPLDETVIDDDPFEDLISEEDISQVIECPYSPREQIFAETAIEVGMKCGILHVRDGNATYLSPAPLATETDLCRFQEWQSVLERPNDVETELAPIPSTSAVLPMEDTTINTIRDIDPTALPMVNETETTEEFDYVLNERQTMVHDIITNHLHDHLLQKNPPQRLLIVQGQGGTGKSALLNAISKTFDDLGASHLLAKTAMSRVAASIIGGQTLHSWAALPIIKPPTDKWITHPSKKIEARHKKNLGGVLWLAIDEMSMLTTPLLLRLSRAAGIVRTGLTTVEPSLAFGNMSLMLIGDLHQFPPVASPRRELYYPFPPDDDCKLGKSYYEQFDVVVNLEEQIQIQDDVWNDILQRTHTGDCTKEDIDTLKKLVLTHPDCVIPNFTQPPWSKTILVTSRNGV
jgi:hypothetical protein